MASKKPATPIPLTVFGALVQSLKGDVTQADREAFLVALRTDVPDLGAVLEQEASSQWPSEDFQAWTRALRAFLGDPNTPHRTRAAAFFRQELPLLAHLAPPSQPSAYNHRDNVSHPEVMLVSDTEFAATLNSPNAKAAASVWLADLLHVWSGRSRVSMLTPPKIERLRAVLYDAGPALTFEHLRRLSNEPRLHADWLKDRVKSGDPVFIRLHEFVTTHLSDPLASAAAKETQKVRHTAATLPLDGAVEQFFAIRKDFASRLKASGRGAVTAEWLNRPLVWSVVRSNAMQGSFIQGLVDRGAIKDQNALAAEPDSSLEASEPRQITPASLAALDATPLVPSVPTNVAHEGLVLYIQSITDKSDLGAVVGALARAAKPLDEELKQALGERANALKFSLQDASVLIEDVPSERPRNWFEGTSRSLLETLRNDAWTVEAVDALWVKTPTPAHMSCVMPLTLVALQSHPNLVAQLSPPALANLALEWSFSQANFIMENHADLLVALQDRVTTLPVPLRAPVMDNYLSVDWNNQKGQETLKRAVDATLAALQPEELEPFVQGVTANGCRPKMAIMLITSLPKVPNPGVLLPGLLDEARNHRPSAPALAALAKLLGYSAPGVENGNDKEVTLASMNNEDKKALLGQVSSAIVMEKRQDLLMQSGGRRRRSYGYENQNDDADKVNISVLKNIGLDLAASLPVQPPSTLGRESLLVESGFARFKEKLSWEGLCELMAPYLAEPRPQVVWTPTPSEKVAPAKAVEPVGGLLDKEGVRARLEQAQVSPDMWRGGRHRMHPMMTRGMFPFDMDDMGPGLESLLHHAEHGMMPIAALPLGLRQSVLGVLASRDLLAGNVFADNLPSPTTPNGTTP